MPLTGACHFRTDRLDVAEWHNIALPAGRELAHVLPDLLTPATTRALPPAWHGDYDRARAASWIRERDDESATLMVLDRATGDPLGLVILFEIEAGDPSGGVELRLGYLLAESAWGRGLGTELVAGLVEWCRSEPRIRSIAGGVEPDNAASARVLTKNGFTTAGVPTEGEQIYELVLADDQA